MSGGSWDYLCFRVLDAADRLIEENGSDLRVRFGRHLRLVYEALKDIEWVDSQDMGEGQEDAAIKAALGEEK